LRNFYQYRPFGKLQYREIGDPFISNSFGYTGHKLDEELNIDWNYCGARYYDPELRIFTQVDPMADQYPSLSPYLYCANNPMTYIDPDGELIWFVAIPLIVAAIVLAFDEYANTPTAENDIYVKTAGDYFLDGLEAWSYIGAGQTAASVFRSGVKFTGKASKPISEGSVSKVSKVLEPKETAAGTKVNADPSIIDDITVGSRGGKSWSTVRRNYWRAEAGNNPSRFGPESLERTGRGLAPQRKSPITGKKESRQLHHKKTRSKGGGHERSNLKEVWPDEHKNMHF